MVKAIRKDVFNPTFRTIVTIVTIVVIVIIVIIVPIVSSYRFRFICNIMPGNRMLY
jgi:hypothetical protein